MSTRSDAAQDFSRLTSEEFDGLWGQKARETLSTFQRILTDYERGIWQQGVNQILNQISSGATTIDNPLRSGWISGLEYVESYFPSLYKHFNALFGDNDTLDVSQVADYYGISSETLQQFGPDTSTEEETPTTPVETDSPEVYIYAEAIADAMDIPDEFRGGFVNWMRDTAQGRGQNLYDVDVDLANVVFNRRPDDTSLLDAIGQLGTLGEFNSEAYLQRKDLSNFTEEEVRGYIESRGINPDDVDYQQYIINDGSIDDARLAQYELQEWMKDNTATAKEFTRVFKDVHGRDPTQEDYDDFFGEGSTMASRTLLTTGSLQTEVENQAKQSLWETQILPALKAGGEFVQKLIFGSSPSGGPKTFSEMLDAWMEAQMNQLKGPLTVTVDPTRGLLAEIMIPVSFEVNGSPLQLPIFDADGNFVLPESIGEAVINVTEAGNRILAEIGGIPTAIGELITGEPGNFVVEIFDAAGNVVSELGLEGLGVADGGGAVGVLTGAVLSGDIFYNNETGRFEEGEEGSLGVDDDLVNGNTDFTEEVSTDTDGQQTGEEDDGLGGLTEEEDEEEDDDGLDEEEDDDGLNEDDTIVTTTDDDDDDTIVTTTDDDKDDTIVTTTDDDDDDTIVTTTDDDDDDTIVTTTDDDKDDTIVTTTDDDKDDTIVTTTDDDKDDTIVTTTDDDDDDTIVTTTDDDDDDTIVTTTDDDDDDTIVTTTDDDKDDEPPVVTNGRDGRDGVDGQDGIDGIDGIDGQDGAPGATGARGAPGAPAPRPGFMGGLSYQLPGFVGVQYQPKDYMRELDRIIGESLFEGMI